MAAYCNVRRVEDSGDRCASIGGAGSRAPTTGRKKGRPKAPLKVSHGRNDYGQAVQVVEPVTVHTGPPITVLR